MNTLFHTKMAEKPFLIIAHRGTWGGNVIENTRQSAELAVRSGADIVELDVCRSADGIFYLYHDGSEAQLLGVDNTFMELTSDDIDETVYRNSLGVSSGYQVEKLADFLAWLPANYLVNLDRSWNYWQEPAFFDLLRASGKTQQLLLKSPIQDTFLERLTQQFMYMPIVTSVADLTVLANYPDIHLVGLELIVKSADSELLETHRIKEWQAQGLLLLANSENLGEDFLLFAHLDDDRSLFQSYDESWGQMLRYGINVIQTDWPHFLKEYRQTVEGSEKHETQTI